MQTKEDIWPIARELLRKELPLRVRLLGIRMSTLKDLTVEDKGIKQVSLPTGPTRTRETGHERWSSIRAHHSSS